ncbi:MAG TPA: hypothetical protein PK622_05430 [Saprospiraceae bacterium]|nr:hypothetical protein [Saprospiraceae bacterium]
MNKSIVSLVSLLLIAILFHNCKSDSESTQTDCTGIVSSYSSTVKAFLDASCATPGCHNSLANSGNVDLSSYAGAKAAGTSGKLVCTIEHSCAKKMPLDAQGNAVKMDDAFIKLIKCWVSSGMPQ